MKLRTTVRILRSLAALELLTLLLLAVPFFSGGYAGVLLWLAVVLLFATQQGYSLHRSSSLSCPLCGRSYGPKILLRARCPHCGEAVPGDGRRVRPLWIPAALLGLLIVAGGIYIRPLPLPDLTSAGEPVTVLWQAPWTWDADLGIQVPTNTRRLVLEPGSAELQAVQTVLDRRTVHRNWETFTGGTSLRYGGLDGALWFSFGDRSLYVVRGRDLNIDGQVYQIGWLGDRAGAALLEDLAAALRLG